MLKNQLLEAKKTLGLTFLDLIEKDKVHYVQSLLDNYTIPAKIADELLLKESTDQGKQQQQLSKHESSNT